MILTQDAVPKALPTFLETIREKPQSWRLISIEFQECEMLHSILFQNICTKNLYRFFNDSECKIFWHRPDYIFIFFQGRAMPIEKCVEGFLKEIEFKGFGRFFDILDLSVDWKNLEQLMTRAFARDDKSNAPAPTTIDFDETLKPVVTGFHIELNAEKIASLKPIRKGRTKPLILLVEDDPFTLQLVKLAFKENFDIITAETARQALVYYGRHVPDMVFLDIQLPDGDGVSLLKQMTQADDNSFIVMLSSHAQKEKILDCMGSGAKGFIGKPFTRQRLMDATDKYKQHREGKTKPIEGRHGT